jgi:hypothetical protein
VVGVLDFEFADNVTDWSRRVREQRVDVRVACSIPKDRLEEAVGRGLRTGDPVAGSGGLLEVGPVKMFVDGSLNTRTAYCDDPYPGTEARGLLETPPDELRATMELAFEHGVRPAVHAIGDQATGIALDAFEQVGCPGRIEHAQLVRSVAVIIVGRDVAERCPVARGARRRRPGAAPCPAGRTGRSDDHRDRPLGCHPGRAAGHGGGRHAARRPVDVSATRVSPAVSSAMPSPDPFAQGA